MSTQVREPDGAGSVSGEEDTELHRAIGPKLLLLFIVGDILGTGVYSLTGKIAGEVGGAAWAPFLLAFAVALVTAFSYLELVTKYPTAAGAALYTHKAFGIHFVTFLVAFTVMSSGITSASTASKAFAANLVDGFGLEGEGSGLVLGVALAFMLLVAAVNFRGVGESVKANVVLTCIELSGLLLVILVGVYAATGGQADFSRVAVFDTSGDRSVFVAVTAATSLAFFAMVGFEDAVNMAEETHDPVRTFPRMMITGIGVTGLIYVLVAVFAVALVPVGELGEGDTPLTKVVSAGMPDFPIESVMPFIAMFAVANSALINMLMASRLIYGMARQDVLPPVLGWVHRGRRTPWVAILFTTALALGLVVLVTENSGDAVAALGGTTALLLLAVFTIVNVAVLVLRRDVIERDHFVTPTVLPVVGAVACFFFVLPVTGRDTIEYVIAAWLLGIGVVLWVLTWLANRAFLGKRTYLRDPEDLSGDETVN
ncbi:APC family permease [Phycicoccus endophyticus]|uniref:APC family permease n=1 Tax=Phycicoccus endophyticus TaxID=1690220 RepID=A0A7G9R4W5_9MICO|nr:APC family permease [Phycicoccus endophyticus]NHI18568.1 APC family permease [Phycicoccus endophyticus]QNN50640.1 APC family permease [Phycicoccus endophyticus]GGL22751.1 amino acid permease [Phycicoccus endophyticus]